VLRRDAILLMAILLHDEVVALDPEPRVVVVEQLARDRHRRSGGLADERHAPADERKRGEAAKEAAAGERRGRHDHA